MTTSDIRIMTYNMGSSIKDYELPHLVNNPTTPEVRSKEFPEKYRMAQTKTASLADQAEIFCLQEVGNWNERPLIQELQRRKFTFLPKLPAPGEALDAVIAVAPRFRLVTGFGPNKGSHWIVAKILDRHTQAYMAVASAHMTGFSLEEYRNMKTVQQKELETRNWKGDQAALVENVNTWSADCSLQIIAADVNANPEVFPEGFQSFTENGFQTLRTGQPTNAYAFGIDPNAEVDEVPDRVRELDFVFTKATKRATTICQRIWAAFRAVFFQRFSNYTTSIDLRNPFGPAPKQAGKEMQWNFDNASDHLPVFARITPVFTPSKICKAARCICGLFARIFCCRGTPQST